MKKILIPAVFWISTLLSGQVLRVGFWNVENLFDLVDDLGTRDEEFALGGKKNVTQEIYELKLRNSASVLQDIDADIMGLCEVENYLVLDDLNQKVLSRKYKIVHFDSPDERGIDNALLYDPEVFHFLKSRAIQNQLPSGDLTRDILYVQGTYQGNSLHIFINHWPSNYGGKEQAIPKRSSTARLLANEIGKILSENLDAEIVVLGDFNEDPTDQNVKMLQSVNMVNLMKPMMETPHTGTYVWRGNDHFYDQVIISQGLRDDRGLQANKAAILDKSIYRQQEGKYAHYPFRFWAGDKLLGGYSDHLPVFVEINAK